MLDVKTDPGGSAREAIEGAIRRFPGIRSADFSPYVPGIARVEREAGLIGAAEIARKAREALAGAVPRVDVVGM